MPAGRFDKLVTLGNGRLEVGGVFVTQGDVIGDVTVRFVLVPDKKPAALTAPIIGTARISRVPRLANSEISQARFRKVVVDTYNLKRGTTVRGIGIAVAIKAPDPPDPPSAHPDPPAFETFTWCVNLKVT